MANDQNSPFTHNSKPAILHGVLRMHEVLTAVQAKDEFQDS